MRNPVSVLSVLLFLVTFASTASAGEVAIYSGGVGWIDKPSADAQSDICFGLLDSAGITTVQYKALSDDPTVATWVTTHTGNGQLDVLVLYGWCPTTIYTGGNGQPNGSLAEAFIESTDGDMILNHADYMFYVSSVNNGEAGLMNMMDNPDMDMWGDNVAIAVTPVGAAISPALATKAHAETDRGFHLYELAGDWYTEASLAQNAAGMWADPAIVRDGNRGRLCNVYQTPDDATLPRGAVASEIIAYLMNKVATTLALVGPATTVAGTPVRYTVQLKDDIGCLAASDVDVTVTLATNSGTGAFDTVRRGAFDGTVTTVTIPAGWVSADFYYKDTDPTLATLKVTNPDLTEAELQVNVLENLSSAVDPGEVAIYTGTVNWTDKATADAQALICVDRLNLMSITNRWFSLDTEQADLATWVTERTGNGELDVLIIYGAFPATLYGCPNIDAETSIAELFIETSDGDTIINHADYMFYVEHYTSDTDNCINGQVALENIMDLPGINMWDDHIMHVTADGSDIAPSLTEYQNVSNGHIYTYRPLHLDLLTPDWFVEAVLAEHSNLIRSEPVVVRKGSLGRLIPLFQFNARNDPKGAVSSEIIAWLHGINIRNPIKLGLLGRNTVTENQPLGLLTVQVQSFLGSPVPVEADTTVGLGSSTGTGRFDTAFNGSFDGTVTSITIPAGASSATFYYKDSAAGTPTLTVSTAGLTAGTLAVNVIARTKAPMGEVAIYTGAYNPDWTPKAMTDAQAGILISRLNAVDITTVLYDTVDLAPDLAQWMKDSKNNGFLDVLVLFGVFPTAIYPIGNTQPNFSIAEQFIESGDGDAIINLGDWMFYCDYDATITRRTPDNGGAGLQNMMDVPGADMGGGDNPMTATSEGKTIAPSLNDFLTDRPLHINTLGGNWMVEAYLANNADGTLADPVIIRDGTKGRLIPVFQTALQADPKGAVAAEIIAWLMQKTLLPTELGLSGKNWILTGNALEVTVSLQDAGGIPYTTASAIAVSLAKDSATGAFDTDAGGAFDGSVTSVTIPAGAKSATFYYKDTATASTLVNLVASAADLDSGSMQVNVLVNATVTKGEVAIYSGYTSWMIDQAATDVEVAACVAVLDGAGITSTLFPTEATEAALATWLDQRTGDGKLDVLVLYGSFPNGIYPAGNTQPNDSVAEKFIESTDGDAILNQADWMFYVSFVATVQTNNNAQGLENMMDVPGATMGGPDNTPVVATTLGLAIAPSLTDFNTDRPLYLNTIGDNWWPEAILAQNPGNPMLAEPVIVRDRNLGRLIPVYQTMAETNPKGTVAGEIIAWLFSGLEGGTEICDNGLDDDGDTLVDCDDPDCSASCGAPTFRRGDADGNGKLDLTDAIMTLQFLYMGFTAPTCMDAADTDDSGLLDLTDAIASLQFQFMGGLPPAAPGPKDCGPDTTPQTSQQFGQQPFPPCVYDPADPLLKC